jgi:hypothetical protein
MKKTALLAAAAALLTAAPAAAQGYLGVEYGNLDFAGVADGDIWQGEGAFGWNSGSWGGQVGASFGNVDFGTGDADFYTLNGHLFWNAGAWRIGGVVATTQSDDADVDEWAYGVEGMFNTTANTNIFASLTAGETDIFGPSLDLWNFDIGGNLYATPNVRIGVLLGFGNVDGGGGSDVDTNTYGINGEFQPWAAPVSITAGWTRFEIDDTGFESDLFQIGARWNFGGGTLQDRNNATPFNTTTGLFNRLYGIY